MRGYKEPGFQERVANARQAKEKALQALRSNPPIDEAAMARRVAKRKAKEAAAAIGREEARAATEAAKLEHARKIAAAAESVVRTEAERKAARDARYAAHKKRNS